VSLPPAALPAALPAAGRASLSLARD